ncbi:MAG: hypothetical protein NTW16_11475 [Bacteroidetes bacterium]|nr:hypothetical protein [Bacteroidota bacterium]
MKTHNGMRPQDVVILLKICTLQGDDWRFQDIAESLKISPSEVSESLERSRLAGLVSESKRTVYTSSFLDFLVSGLKYVFPALPGAVVRGFPTAHSAPPINTSIVALADVIRIGRAREVNLATAEFKKRLKVEEVCQI